ncbi:MAG: ice-binding family protein, partial [Sedimentibacter sp.]
MLFYAQPIVNLGTANNFAILAGSGITNTGPTTIKGDVGTFPTTTETGFGTIIIIGTNHAGDAVTQGAKINLVTAYNDAASRTPATTVS